MLQLLTPSKKHPVEKGNGLMQNKWYMKMRTLTEVWGRDNTAVAVVCGVACITHIQPVKEILFSTGRLLLHSHSGTLV